MSGRVQQIGLTGQPTTETIPGGKPSVRSEIWVNVSAFFQLDTITMSDRQFWFLGFILGLAGSVMNSCLGHNMY